MDIMKSSVAFSAGDTCFIHLFLRMLIIIASAYSESSPNCSRFFFFFF